MVDRTKYLDRAKGGRIYFRTYGKRQRLPGEEGYPEFNAAYDALIAGALTLKPPHEKRPKLNTPGTIGWFTEKYLASDYFVGRDGRKPRFSPGTQLNYRPVLESIRSTLGPARLADLTSDNVDVYLAKVQREHSPSVAMRHKILLSNLWKFARGFAEFKRNGKTNPTADAAQSTPLNKSMSRGRMTCKIDFWPRATLTSISPITCCCAPDSAFPISSK